MPANGLNGTKNQYLIQQSASLDLCYKTIDDQNSNRRPGRGHWADKSAPELEQVIKAV